MYSVQAKDIYAGLYKVALEKLACSYCSATPKKSHGQKNKKKRGAK